MKISEFSICALSPFSLLEQICETKKYKTNVHEIERKPRHPPRKPDPPWFYYVCETSCPADCDEHHRTEIEMKDSTDEERKRIDYYRNQIKWRGGYDCAIEYILDFQRYDKSPGFTYANYLRIFRTNGQDFYKVKWSGWPEIAWQWVHISNIDALEKILDFRSAMISQIPTHHLPRQIPKQKKYNISNEYKSKIKTNYKKQKDELKIKLVEHQNRLRKIDPTVLVENEEDLVDFPPEKVYKFIKSTTYKLPEEDMVNVRGTG